MNHATPRMRSFAKCLIDRVQIEDGSVRTENVATLSVVEMLRPQLEELMGNTGYRALLLNALARAKDEVPWLGEARMNQDGSFEGFDQPLARRGRGRYSKGGAVMLAWFLGLLASFIGELLTIQLTLEVWPDLSLNKCFTLEDHEKVN